MSRFIYVTLMSLFIGSTLIGLAACASDGYSENEDYDGHHKPWLERSFSRHSGNGFAADEILSGGINQ